MQYTVEWVCIKRAIQAPHPTPRLFVMLDMEWRVTWSCCPLSSLLLLLVLLLLRPCRADLTALCCALLIVRTSATFCQHKYSFGLSTTRYTLGITCVVLRAHPPPYNYPISPTYKHACTHEPPHASLYTHYSA